MWATFGWKVTLLYAVIAATVSVMANMLLDKFGFERHVIDPKEATQFCYTSGCGPAPSTTTQVAIRDNQRSTIRSIKPLSRTACYAAPQPKMAGNATLSCCNDHTAVLTSAPQIPTAWVKARIDAWQQFKAVLPFLLLGVLVGSFIYGFIPAEWIAAHAGADNPLAILFSTIVGIPLYIRAEALIPLTSVLLGKGKGIGIGIGIGAVMALIIGSAGASLTEVILLKSMFRTPDDCGLPYRDPRHGDLDGLSDAAAVLNYQCFKPPGFE